MIWACFLYAGHWHIKGRHTLPLPHHLWHMRKLAPELSMGELAISLTGCSTQEGSPAPHLGSRVELALVMGVEDELVKGMST